MSYVPAYIFTNYDTNVNYTDGEANSTTFVFVTENSNKIYVTNDKSNFTTVSVRTSTITVGNYGVHYYPDGYWRFGIAIDNGGSTTDLTGTIPVSSDLVNFSTETYHIAFGMLYDFNYNIAFPSSIACFGLSKNKDYLNENILGFDVEIIQTYPPTANSYYYNTIYYHEITSITTTDYSTSCDGYTKYSLNKYYYNNVGSITFGDGCFAVCESINTTVSVYNTQANSTTVTTTKIYVTQGTVTTTIDCGTNYYIKHIDSDNSITACAVGDYGHILVIDAQNKTYEHRQESNNINLNFVKYSPYQGYFLTGGQGVILALMNLSFETNGLPSEIVVYSTGNNTLASQFKTYPQWSATIASQIQTYLSNKSTLQSILLQGSQLKKSMYSQLRILNNLKEDSLSSQLKIVAVTGGGKLKSVITSFDVPSRNYDISFKGMSFKDYGIYITNWRDEFSKNTDFEKNYSIDGVRLKSFSYFGENRINLSGFILGDKNQVEKFLNGIAHEKGKLYKRTSYYTIAQLYDFHITPSSVGKHRVEMTFIADTPYFEYEKVNEYNETHQFYKMNDYCTLPITIYNKTKITNDNTDFIMINQTTTNNFSTDDFIIARAYSISAKLNDTSPKFYELNNTDFINASYLDVKNFSVGCIFPQVVFINKFYVHSGYDSTKDINRLFEIYYWDFSNNYWEQYTKTFIIYRIYLANVGWCYAFDKLQLTTNKFKIRYVGDTDNAIYFGDAYKATAIVVPNYFTKFVFNDNNIANDGINEYLWDIKNNKFFINLTEKGVDGDMLKIYPQFTQLITSREIKVNIKYKFNDLYFAI